jgi:hypothetical protein
VWKGIGSEPTEVDSRTSSERRLPFRHVSRLVFEWQRHSNTIFNDLSVNESHVELANFCDYVSRVAIMQRSLYGVLPHLPKSLGSSQWFL